MYRHRAVFLDVIGIADENEELPESSFWAYFHDTYAITQAVAVRRQADTRSGVGTLDRLITEIAGDPKRCSREFWVGLWEKDPRPEIEALKQAEANSIFTDQFAGDVGDHLDPVLADDPRLGPLKLVV
jgi:hypothetical protein